MPSSSSTNSGVQNLHQPNANISHKIVQSKPQQIQNLKIKKHQQKQMLKLHQQQQQQNQQFDPYAVYVDEDVWFSEEGLFEVSKRV